MKRRCDKCSELIEQQTVVCVECGSLQRLPAGMEAVECENHPDERAVGCCVVCGKPVCGDCATGNDARLFCDDPEHERLSEEWEALTKTDSQFEADMIAANLKQRGFEPRVYPHGDHIAMSWFPELRCVRVMLLKQRIAEGRETLSFLGLAGDLEESP